jgi:hypothetical protein
VRRVPTRHWRVIAERSAATTFSFRGLRGRTYEVRVRASDAAGNAGGPAFTRVAVPWDQVDEAVHLSAGWTRAAKRRRAYGGSVAVARRPGASARLRFKGREVYLSAAGHGRLRVTLDGRTRTVHVRGHRGLRDRPAFARAGLRPGRVHRLRVRALDAGVLLDAVAVSR